MTKQEILNYCREHFPIKAPIVKDGVIWNGKPDEFSNISGNIGFSQEFGRTPYSAQGMYGVMSNGEYRDHNGHDYAGSRSTILCAPRKSKCAYVGWDANGYGNFLFMETEEVKMPNVTFKVEYVLAHFSSISAKMGNWYEQGDELGKMGSTGFSTGPHTHFAPRILVKDGKGWKWLFAPDENTRGYSDPYLFYNDADRPVFDKQELINESKYMSNVKVIKDKDSSAVGFWMPAISEASLNSLSLNFGIKIPKTASGDIDWETFIEGELTFN